MNPFPGQPHGQGMEQELVDAEQKTFGSDFHAVGIPRIALI